GYGYRGWGNRWGYGGWWWPGFATGAIVGAAAAYPYEPLAKPLFPGIKTESDGARIRIGARTPFYFASSSYYYGYPYGYGYPYYGAGYGYGYGNGNGCLVYRRTYNRMAKSVAIVTGASQGIGRATAICLARNFSALVLVARDRANLDETAEAVKAAGAEALVIDIDLAQPTAAQRVAAARAGRGTFGGN